MGFDLSELVEPVEVWKAVEGDPSELIALLRSDEKLGRWRRDALADWLEGKLRPVELRRGRPPSPAREGAFHALIFGHNVATALGAAGLVYEMRRRYIRKKGWHLKQAGRFYWSSERLMAAVASRYGIEPEKLVNYLRRAGRNRQAPPKSPAERVERRRLAIALQIRRAKIGPKG